MMMFYLDITFAVELIALAVGIILLVWGKRHEGAGVSLAKGIGSLITILALATLLCTGYYGFKYLAQGYFVEGMSCGVHDQMMMQDRKMDRDHSTKQR